MSPRTEETNQHIRQEQKQKILDAAQIVFAHKGYTDTKMTDIAAAAEVSYGLAYHYFANKEEIFVTIVKWALQSAVRFYQEALQHPGTAWDRLHLLTTQILSGMREEPTVFMVVLQAFTNDTVPSEARALAIQQGKTIQSTLRQLITEGQTAGEIAPGNPDRLAAVFSACIGGLALGSAFPAYGSNVVDFPEPDDVLRLLKP